MIGRNIRNLRLAFGETQEQLADAIGVEKTAVSNYENGRRDLDRERLESIARHYGVLADELVHGDFSDVGTFEYDPDAFLRHVDAMFPIVGAGASAGDGFKRALQLHRDFLNGIREGNLDGFGSLEEILDGYGEEIDGEGVAAPEAAANLLSAWYLLLLILRAPSVAERRPAALSQLAKRDRRARNLMDFPDAGFAEDAEDALESLDDSGSAEMADTCKRILKMSGRRADLLYYLIALEYVVGAVNGVDYDFSNRVGNEMIAAFAAAGNRYAVAYLGFVAESLGRVHET